MRANLFCASAAALILCAAAGLASAQNTSQNSATPAPPGTAQDPNKPAAPTESDRAGPQEPGSKAPMPPAQPVLEKGALAVPGAPADVDTLPAKWSERSEADDRLPTAAYTLKHLTAEQRHAIFESLRKTQGPSAPVAANGELYAVVGAALPGSVTLHPLPDDITSSMPETKAYWFTRAGDRFVLVRPNTMMVVGVLPQ